VQHALRIRLDSLLAEPKVICVKARTKQTNTYRPEIPGVITCKKPQMSSRHHHKASYPYESSRNTRIVIVDARAIIISTTDLVEACLERMVELTICVADSRHGKKTRTRYLAKIEQEEVIENEKTWVLGEGKFNSLSGGRHEVKRKDGPTPQVSPTHGLYLQTLGALGAIPSIANSRCCAASSLSRGLTLSFRARTMFNAAQHQ
jgi:hypothetical protein